MPQNGKALRVVVVGGGISGLSAAWYLQKHAKWPLQVSVLEKTYRWGGVLQTEKIPGPNGETFIVDGGPESFISRKPEAWELVEELGLHERVIDTGSETRDMYVLDGGKPVAVPLAPLAFLRSPLLSWRGKARLALEPFIQARRDDEDESLAAFVDRRLGREAREKFVGPILAGIYNTDPETQSILTTSPVMRQMEREFGGLFKGALGTMRRRARERRQAQAAGQSIPPRFFAFREGAGELTQALVTGLQGDLNLGVSITGIEEEGLGYRISLEDGHILSADALILSTPAHAAAGMLRQLAPQAADVLAGIRYANIGTLSLVYDNRAFQTGLRFNGLMIPRQEKRAIDAITWTSAKLPGRAPGGYTLLKVYFGGGSPDIVNLEEDELVSVVRAELRALVGIDGVPVAQRAYRWPVGFPLADVGHLQRVEALEAHLPPRIYLAGNAYRGIGVPDCIRQGREAAKLALAELDKKESAPNEYEDRVTPLRFPLKSYLNSQ
jgi:oxygen-dependent protoporphyrinogen oxidase